MTYFAKRTNWDLRTNELTQILNGLKQSGEIIYDLTVSNPTRCRFQYPQEILKNLSLDDNMLYGADAKGILSARKAVARYYQERGAAISSDQIFLTASTSEAYSFLFRLLADPGQKIVFPKPSYPLFAFLSELNDVGGECYRLYYDRRWALDESCFVAALMDARAAVIVNPNNPTGSCFSDRELSCIDESCARKNVPIICDEVFLDYGFDEQKNIESLACKNDQLIFVLGGLSKALALPQMKLSWIAVNGPEDQRNEAIKRLEVIADTYLSVNTPAQHALAHWMNILPVMQDQVRKRIRENRQWLSQEIKKANDRVELLNADGGWSAVVKLKHVDDDEDFVKDLLLNEHVFIHPGYFFDFDEEGFFVVSLLPPTDIFNEGVARFLKKAEDREL